MQFDRDVLDDIGVVQMKTEFFLVILAGSELVIGENFQSKFCVVSC